MTSGQLLVRIGSVIAGRAARSLLKAHLRGVPEARRRLVLLGGTGVFLGACVGGGVVYYALHLEQCSFTGRLRFMPSSRQWEGKLSEELYKTQLSAWENDGVSLVRDSDSRKMRVVKICSDLVHAVPLVERALGKCLDLSKDQLCFQVTLIEDASTHNANVLPNGHIFVYTGMLDLCGDGPKGDARLAAVLGHEIAHALLRHPGERLGGCHLLLATHSIFSFVASALIPEELFDLLHAPAIMQLESLQLRLLDAVVSLPNSRKQEFEADYLGIMLSSAARYDPKEAPLLWMELADRECEHNASTPEIFSTHPGWDDRSEKLREWQPEALALSKGELIKQ